MKTGKYTNVSQQRILRLILALFGDVVHGYAPSVLARHIGCHPSAMTRDLANLEEAGLAERIEKTECWRLTARLQQQAVKIYAAQASAERQFVEDRDSIHRTY